MPDGIAHLRVLLTQFPMSFILRASLLALSIVALLSHVNGQSFSKGSVTYIKDAQRLPDATWQNELREQASWQEFIGAHPQWSVEFNEASGKPRRAFGPPITTQGDTPEERAQDFIATALAPFGIPQDELVHLATIPTEKLTYIHYAQQHQGLPVLHSRLMVKLDQAGRVISFAADVHDGITIDLQPSIQGVAASNAAAVGLTNVVDIEDQGLRVLPIPQGHMVDHRLVHELVVNTRVGETPGRYRSYVDAHTAQLWYRANEVMDHRSCARGHDHCEVSEDAGADAQVNATVQANGPLQATQVLGLPELRVTINGDILYTDADGMLASGIPGPVDAQVQLRGRWSTVTTNNITPSITVDLSEGANTVSFDAGANIRERTAYYAVNKIHEHMKNVIPTFVGMDSALPTKVDVTGGDCNAFYDGASINFYAEGNGCRSLALVPDVVYHEYGHGINDKFYQSLSGSFINGAMNEGYADVWALTLTQEPVLALGWQTSSATSYIRRYDQAPKVYPVDLVGQVHADGEIIAGAWYSTSLNLDDMALTLDLFAQAYPGLQAMAANGQEGAAYRDVLIDVLQADDDDGDITNGTPNGLAIVEGFARHGITLLSNVSIQHTAVVSAIGAESIPVSATVNISFPFTTYLTGVRAFYRSTADTDWESVLMTNSSGNQYAAAFPAQAAGTVLAYYIAIEDIFGQTSSVQPTGAAQADPNVPYFIMVGFDLRATEDGDLVHELGNWTSGVPSDNATSGLWEQNVPIPSWSGASATGVMVQPGLQTTPNGEFCWVTGNATNELATMGENDVDGGVTTMISGNIDLTGYQVPTFSYNRWYINNPPGGANPNADWWQVQVSSDGGATWVPLEDTRTSDRSWRRVAFRVQDHVPLTSTFRIKFMASDSVRAGQNSNGGSLVEAAIDDILLWDVAAGTGIADAPSQAILAIYPSPASDLIQVELDMQGKGKYSMEVVDMTGRVVLSPRSTRSSGPERIDVRKLLDGQYVLRIVWEGGHAEKRFTVLR
jgi:hypothetical protein